MRPQFTAILVAALLGLAGTAHAADGTGLKGQYFDDTTLSSAVHTRTDPTTTTNGPPPGFGSTADPSAALTAGPEPPWLNWVGTIPTTTAQRLACDSDIWRIILDPTTGLPLDVGRTHRLVPTWIRKALHARDRGCRWPGCTAAASWTGVTLVTSRYGD